MRVVPRSRRATAGFTLVEVLVALVLAGLVVGAVAMVTAQWLPQWRRGFARVEAGELLALAVDRLAADIAAAEFVPASLDSRRPLFEGSASAVTFVRTAFGPNAGPGLEIVAFAAADEARGAGLVRRTAAFVPRLAEAGAPPFGPPVGLLAAAYRASFSFSGRDGVWIDRWTGADVLPRAVRIVVRDTRTGRVLDASTAVVIRAELPAACAGEETLRICGKAQPIGATAPGDGAAAGPGGPP
ncbi:prepilin-type N-terminal cleavage/methylation domain-containing protein [Xanthobacter dioxanivorans]|uniref:Prepilin-type N-terminal cleavage/methylation domain-containing protein n=1 Tax=Xanthobacter dioxanivorans TaxID=2528964 RepID=A0A974PQT5_9HYPH|nr:prepilin-type N-terminal cleavage/methylation domain-containing protein [Xanthobacter dioxanivorans]QRG08067.1 prepilin-type N-terminal cleavage/methylation domain-containing protein [Xanthobacter dioxanivorans]